MPNRLGPILFLPASVVWHRAHFLNAVLPASTSAAKTAHDAAWSTAPKARAEIWNRILPPTTWPAAAASIAVGVAPRNALALVGRRVKCDKRASLAACVNQKGGGSRGDPRCCRLQGRGAARDRDSPARRPEGRGGFARDQGDRDLPHRRVHLVGSRSRRALSGDPRT